MLIASWPLSLTLSVHGRIGAVDARVEYRERSFAVLDFTDTRRIDIARRSPIVPLFVPDVGWAFSANVEARIDWTRADGARISKRLAERNCGGEGWQILMNK